MPSGKTPFERASKFRTTQPWRRAERHSECSPSSFADSKSGTGRCGRGGEASLEGTEVPGAAPARGPTLHSGGAAGAVPVSDPRHEEHAMASAPTRWIHRPGVGAAAVPSARLRRRAGGRVHDRADRHPSGARDREAGDAPAAAGGRRDVGEPVPQPGPELADQAAVANTARPELGAPAGEPLGASATVTGG